MAKKPTAAKTTPASTETEEAKAAAKAKAAADAKAKAEAEAKAKAEAEAAAPRAIASMKIRHNGKIFEVGKPIDEDDELIERFIKEGVAHRP